MLDHETYKGAHPIYMTISLKTPKNKGVTRADYSRLEDFAKQFWAEKGFDTQEMEQLIPIYTVLSNTRQSLPHLERIKQRTATPEDYHLVNWFMHDTLTAMNGYETPNVVEVDFKKKCKVAE